MLFGNIYNEKKGIFPSSLFLQIQEHLFNQPLSFIHPKVLGVLLPRPQVRRSSVRHIVNIVCTMQCKAVSIISLYCIHCFIFREATEVSLISRIYRKNVCIHMQKKIRLRNSRIIYKNSCINLRQRYKTITVKLSHGSVLCEFTLKEVF